MSNRELKSEVIRLVNEVDENRMEDLLLSIRSFMEHQNVDNGIDANSPELLKELNQSLLQAELGQLISNNDVLTEVKRVLRDKMDSARKG
ncbi:hypothetical protein MUK70_23120 [Dyadobacter chenwenxiniae]|uniref:Uncharacterized protein n=1 Tax=Dyadobacter chenwenxiniae TaxID=2906456 RepID=A0A9X1PKL5_9BACT|nr:hypothetical protein [Dyadobacter chenwenxiniae]MCF0062135.1 hypothetical protein [Dyadobacter chenwenxiniae]UON81939.1 hypothetical protein MUK70_23120 [Dyadobacter chenwenxiniae]